MKTNRQILDMVKEITVARMSNSTTTTNSQTGQDVADFMDSIYKKLVELNTNEDSAGFPNDSTD